jgi:hypothetical protein
MMLIHDLIAKKSNASLDSRVYEEASGVRNVGFVVLVVAAPLGNFRGRADRDASEGPIVDGASIAWRLHDADGPFGIVRFLVGHVEVRRVRNLDRVPLAFWVSAYEDDERSLSRDADHEQVEWSFDGVRLVLLVVKFGCFWQ